MTDTQGRHEQAVVDSERGWAVCRCGNGCLHVTLDRLMVTLTEGEFHSLVALMQRARDCFGGVAGAGHAGARSH